MTIPPLRRLLFAAALAAAVAGCGQNDPAKFVASAEGYIAKNNYSAALIEVKNALATAPDNAKARFLLGKLLLESGDPVGASAELRKALALHYPADDVYPLLARAWSMQGAAKSGMQEFVDAPVQSAHAKAEMLVVLAMAAVRDRDPAQAQAKIDQALALDPGNVAAHVAQARLLADRDDVAGALKLVDAIAADAPDNLEVHMLRAQYQIALAKREDARRTLEQVVAKRPDAFMAHYMLASIYMQDKEVDNAAAQVEIMKKQAPKDARTLHAVAMVAYARGDNAAALDAVQRSLQVAPDFLPARYLSGLVDMRRGAYGSAEQSLRAVLAVSPAETGARAALAQALLSRGQPMKAKETLQPVLDKQPNDIGALRLAAEIEIALKRPESAMAYIERANRLEDNNLNGRIRLAQVQVAKGDTAQGISELQKLAAADTAKSEPDLALIETYVQAHAYDKALAAADALIQKNPRSAAAYNAKGTVYGVQGDVKNARPLYEKALSLEPDNVGVQFNLANLDGIERKFDDAKKRFQQILAKDPKSERALIGIAQVLVASGAPPEEVIAALNRAVAANPSSAAPRQALMTYYAMRKDWKGAITAGQEAVAAIPDVPAVLEGLAAAQIAGGEKNRAIETYQRIAKLQPDNPVPWMRIGGIHASLKNYDEAIAALKNAAAIAPSNVAVWVGLASLYRDANKFDAGFNDARRLQKDLSTRVAGYGLEAELLAAQNKLPEAVAAYRTTSAREPLPMVVVRSATFLGMMGKDSEAAAMTRKWIDEHPKDVIVRTYLGQQSMGKGDYKSAAQYLRAASDSDPQNLSLLNDLAWSMAQMKDPKAVEYAQRAYRLAPNNAAVANTYGWALFQSGDADQGIRFLRRAVDIDPSDAGRRLFLAKALMQTGDKPAARKELEIVANADSPRVSDEAKQLLQKL